jgi:hypothetical protein
MRTPPPLPWRYPFQLDVPRFREVLRPVVSVRLRGADLSSGVIALVDSGSEHILAGPWLASDTAVDLTNPKYVETLGIGGRNVTVEFVDMHVRLQHPSGDDDDFIEWEAEVGFPNYWGASWPVLLGQHGFFDRFTVSMHRSAALTVVEEWQVFDKRFGIELGEADEHTLRHPRHSR